MEGGDDKAASSSSAAAAAAAAANDAGAFGCVGLVDGDIDDLEHIYNGFTTKINVFICSRMRSKKAIFSTFSLKHQPSLVPC